MTNAHGGSGGWLALALAACWPLCAPTAAAATAGAWETFYTQNNTSKWFIWDYTLDDWRAPWWSGVPTGEEYAYTTYTQDGTVSFNADSQVAQGAFTGNYQAERISGVACDIYIGQLSALDMLDCAIFANGPAGKRFYHSPVFLAEDFSEGGWWSVFFSFNRQWSYWNGSVWVDINPKLLTEIEQIEIAFTPKEGSSGGSTVGLDNVTLEPTLAAPAQQTALTNPAPRQFRLSFTPGPGMECRVEKMRLPPATGWDTVSGQTGIVGPSLHVFSTPVTPATGIFRVAAQPHYTLVVSP